MNKAIFNKNGVVVNSVLIKRFGNEKCYFDICGAEIDGFIHAEIEIMTPLQGESYPLTRKSLDFESIDECLNFYSRIAPNILKKYDKKHSEIILRDIKQKELNFNEI